MNRFYARCQRWQGPLLVVGFSGRALAASARVCEISACVVDACADLDTCMLADGAVWRAPVADGFNERLLEIVWQVRQVCRPRGWVAASGLEATPSLIDAVTHELGQPLYGNSGAVVARVKEPRKLHAVLRRCGLAMPETRAPGITPAAGWLLKRRGGCGGGHVRPADSAMPTSTADYAQRRVVGTPGSAVFITDGYRVRLIGINRLYPLDAVRGDYRHGAVLSTRRALGTAGAVLPVALTRLVRETGLKGLCGMDFIIEPNGQLQVLELNPRWPASAELHTQTALALHLDACLGRLPRHPVARAQGVCAIALCYARRPFYIPAGLHWPAWVSDRSSPGRRYTVGEPVCTVRATAADESRTRALLARRLRRLCLCLGGDVLGYPQPTAAQESSGQ